MSQFEREIKNVLENYEMSADNGAWNDMERKMNASNRSSFYKQFVVAGLVLTASLLVLTNDFGSSENANDHLVAENHQTESTVVNPKNVIDETTSTALLDEKNAVEETNALNNIENVETTTQVNELEKIASTNSVADNLSEDEKNHLININEKIKEKSENNFVREYVGKNFNLNANAVLNRNDENDHGVFLPEAINEGDKFVMEIYNKNEELIFVTSDINKPWKGHNQVTDSMTEAGNYMWKVTLDKINGKEIFKGVIMVK